MSEATLQLAEEQEKAFHFWYGAMSIKGGPDLPLRAFQAGWAQGSAELEAQVRALVEALRGLVRINTPAYDFCKEYPQRFVPAAEGMEAVVMDTFVDVYVEARAALALFKEVV